MLSHREVAHSVSILLRAVADPSLRPAAGATRLRHEQGSSKLEQETEKPRGIWDAASKGADVFFVAQIQESK
ncbi:hypothetical protein F442_22281 [Phytophthora nicotianae P10297]|uniref:Uncharacterized protein n=1 Tax=Phytophthora nicotianae P10297 TaxID=1317064 RepID=W2XZZ2_PHYNI|nr:hypothetical protein F442_22281 [Phytophthora nicotianae P10297]